MDGRVDRLMDGPTRVIFEIFKKLIDFFFMQANVWPTAEALLRFGYTSVRLFTIVLSFM